jgi:hypothetical protein
LGAAWFDDLSLREASGSTSMSADVPDPDDVDADGLLNEFEAEQFLNPQLLDTDGDSLSDDQEFAAGGSTYEDLQSGEASPAGEAPSSGSSAGCGLLGLEAVFALTVGFFVRRRL